MSKSNKIIVLVDVSNLAWRCWYGNETLMTTTGNPSGHVFGAASSMFAFLRNHLSEKEATACFCYDGENSVEYRRSILPEYKANRNPRDFNPVPEVSKLLSFWPGEHWLDPKKEADDMVAYLVQKYGDQDIPIVIISGDKDCWPLLKNKNVHIFSPNKGRYITFEDFYKDYKIFGNTPEKITLAKSLFGDSDNVKGVFRLLKAQVEPILNTIGVVTPDDFYRFIELNPTLSYMSANTRGKLSEAKERVYKNYQVILPMLNVNDEQCVKFTGTDKLLELYKMLEEFECATLLPQVAFLGPFAFS